MVIRNHRRPDARRLIGESIAEEKSWESYRRCCPANLKQLRDSGWVSKTVKQEIRDNFLRMLEPGEELFPGISATTTPSFPRSTWP